MPSYYVSVTGLKLKSFFYLPRFMYHAAQSTKQAHEASGIVHVDAGYYRQGVIHTLTVWEDRNAMRQYMIRGAHAEAMRVTDLVSQPNGTKVYGFECDHIPTWEEALPLWEEHGTRHGKKVVSVASSTQRGSSTTGAATANMTVRLSLAVPLVLLALLYFYQSYIVRATDSSVESIYAHYFSY